MHHRQQLFGVSIDAVRMPQAIDQIFDWLESPADHCRFVVTPNVDHTVILSHNAGLQAAYRDAALVLADGQPVVWASRLLRKPLPERVPGSDLVPRLFDAAARRRSLTTFLLGAAEGVAERAAEHIHRQWPAVRVVGTDSPPLGFEHRVEEETRILAKIDDCSPDVLIVGLGAPKQELWTHRHFRHLNARVALCVGATIDFLAGEKSRAPRWMQAMGLEWLHRISTDPGRLAKRYAKDAWVFPQLVWKEWSRLRSTAELSKSGTGEDEHGRTELPGIQSPDLDTPQSDLPQANLPQSPSLAADGRTDSEFDVEVEVDLSRAKSVRASGGK